jgi:hypothetical protein
MKERISIAVVILVVAVVYFCLIVHARGQGFTPRRPFILQLASPGGGGTNGTPYAVPGIYLWWNYQDALAQGTNVAMTNWVDRIQGLIFTNQTAGYRPTIETNGVKFDGSSTFLTNISPGVWLASSYSLIFVVLDWIYTGNSRATYLCFNTNLAVGSRAYTLQNTWNWEERVNSGSFYDLGANGGIKTNVLFSLSSMNVLTNDMFFTNGVRSRLGSTGGSQMFNNLGGIIFSEWGFQGWIRDVIVYTNVFLDPLLITNLQYWASTNYGLPYYGTPY